MSHCLLITTSTIRNRSSKKVVESPHLVFKTKLVQVSTSVSRVYVFLPVSICVASFVTMCILCTSAYTILKCACLVHKLSLDTGWTWGHGAAAASSLLGCQIKQLLAHMSDLFKFKTELFIFS